MMLLLLLLLSTLQTTMDQVNLGHSTKNIPIPGKSEYLQSLIDSAEKFIRSIRLKTFFYLNPNENAERKNTYDFNSSKSPPKIPELKDFEDEMLKLVQSVEFKSSASKFQCQLSKNKNEIRNCDRLLVFADKTTNFYKVTNDRYDKLIDTNINKNYRKASPSLEKAINEEDKQIASELKIDDRVNIMAKQQSFVTLKDHKPNFNNKPTCRMINPAKSEIGKISKQILERINVKTRNATNLNQWKNTTDVLTWFNKVENNQHNSFINFDICDFYPSITESLLKEALSFAGQYSEITDQEKRIIIHAKKSLLYNKHSTWCKKGSTHFDVTMGSFDGAETCELIGLYLLSQLQHLNINVGIYRDDGLAICNRTPRQTEIIKKEICKVFSRNNLKITIDANKKSVDFLDTTFDLRTTTHRPFMKPNNTPLYVHKDSNHPPNIIKHIPESINKRLSTISSNETIFNQSVKPYQEALHKSGYSYKLHYDHTTKHPENKSKNGKRNRRRNITWFNPPYSNNVSTNVGKCFLKILDKCFPTENQLHTILNRKTVKISYSCMPNMKNIINNHNNMIIKNNRTNPPTPKCNCRIQNSCPLNGKCLTTELVYQATVTRNDNQQEETYIGLTENTFKTRYNGHTSSFSNEEKKNSTTLSQYIWSLKEKKIAFTMKC